MPVDPPKTAAEVAETVLQDPRERKRLAAFALSRYGIHREDAEDLLQETALALLPLRKQIRSPRGFAFAAFRRSCKKFLFRLHNSTDLAPLAEADLEAVSSSEQLDLSLALRQGLAAVSRSCRKILTAHYIRGETLRETSISTAFAYSSLGNLVGRCLRRLRACLA